MDMQRRVTIVIAACIAGLLGSYFYAGILNPLKVEWLLQEGDLLQHFLGWHYYRHEPWDWPIGALHTYGSEVRSSIVFTDSLPLLAIPLKLIQAWLPNPFQYQGLASVAHLILNAIAACLIFTRLKMSPIAAIALSLVVAIMPPVLFRGPGGAGHESLMAHWTFLFAIYLVLFSTDPGWKARCQWALMLTLAVLVHFYLFLLVGLLWSLWWLLRTSQQYRLKGLAYHRQWWLLWGAYSLLQPLIILFVMWGVGYLHSGGESPGADGFGFYSAELVAYFNAYSFLPGIISASVALPVWVPGIGGQYEGMSYVGAGIMALWLMALLLFIRRPIRIPSTYRWPVRGLGALAIGLFIFALSDKVVIGPYTVNLPLPWPESLKAILRASGRMVWVLMYLSIFLAGAILVQRLTPRNATLAALCVLVIQLFDLQHWHHYFHTRSQQAATYHMAEDPRFTGWDSSDLQAALSQRQSLHITQADDIVGMLPLAWLAGQHGMAVNVAYVARITPSIIHQAVAPAQQALMAGQPDPSVVYAITNPEAVQQACSLTNMQCIATPMATFAWQLTSEETQ